jgi:hypothetical protein
MGMKPRSVDWFGTAVLGLGAIVGGCKAQEAPPHQPTRAVSGALVASASTSGAATSPRSTIGTGQARRPAFDGETPLVSTDVPASPVPAVQGDPPDVLVSPRTKYAIVVSVDGLAPRFLEALLRQGKTPTFAALQKSGAWTHNARTDKTFTITLPNHTSMITGLPVSSSPGFDAYRAHRYTDNGDPLPGATLHSLRGNEHPYTSSMFDVAHDHGLSTAMYASKTKFAIYSQTYNDAGAADTIGVDNGHRKIDTVVIKSDVVALTSAFVAQLKTAPPNLTFLHFGTPDAMGHRVGWGSPAYFAAVQQVDALLGHILKTIQESEQLANRTALVITADHGGVGNHHDEITDIRNFQIPFYVLAPGVRSADAYDVFEARSAPGSINPEYNAPQQPLRNGDAGNVAVYLLGLPQIPDSVIQSAGLVAN